jgi:hypothetical protein
MIIKFPLGLKYQDYIFIIILIFNIVLVTYLGTDLYHEAVKLDIAKSNGEAILARAKELTEDTDRNISREPQTCLTKEISNKDNTWKECLQELFDSKGKFNHFKNSIEETNPVVSRICDKQVASSKGSFIFEKVNINPTGIPTFSPLEDSETLVKGLTVRLSVCDRGYYRIIIGEISL